MSSLPADASHSFLPVVHSTCYLHSLKMARFLSLVGLAAVGLRSAAALPSVEVASNATGEMHIMDESPNFPSDPNTIVTCTWWWDNDGSISCQNMAAEWGISMANFLAWVRRFMARLSHVSHRD